MRGSVSDNLGGIFSQNFLNTMRRTMVPFCSSIDYFSTGSMWISRAVAIPWGEESDNGVKGGE